MVRSGRRWLGGLLYAFSLVLFVEGSLQLFYRVTTGSWLAGRAAHPIFAPNPVMGFQNRPNLSYELSNPEFESHVYTNAEGFRTSSAHEEFAFQKRPGTLRVLLLGPSFTFGWGVDYEQTWAARLKDYLRDAHLGRWQDVEVINAGVDSMPPRPQLRWYRAVGSRYSPDLVVQLIYGSMAVDSRIEAPYRVADDFYLIPTDSTRLQRTIAELKKSATVFYAWVIWNRILERTGHSGDGRVVGAGRELRLHSTFDPESSDVKASSAFYDDLRTAVEGSGARLLMVYAPLSFAVHRGDLSRWAHQGVHDVDDQIAFDAAFCEYLRTRKIDCLNVSADLVAAAESQGSRLYYWLDVHWTPRGNEVVAQAIVHHLIPTLDPGAVAPLAMPSANQP